MIRAPLALLLTVLVPGTARAEGEAASVAWRTVDRGVDVAEVRSPVPSSLGDSTIAVVRVDPAMQELKLLGAKALGLERGMRADEWVARHGLSGAINASMYRDDHLTPLSYMKAGDVVLQGKLTKDKTLFAAEPTEGTLPLARIIDRSCEELDALRGRYRILVQGIRMLGCKGENVWQQQPKKWSTACVGADRGGRLLFIHARSPWTTHDLVDILRALPLELERLMYVEGGPEAFLHVVIRGEVVLSRVGSYETGFNENDDNQEFWPIPNVIGFRPRGGR